MPRYLALDWDQNQLHLVAANVRGGKVTVERAAVWQEETTPPTGDAEALGKLLRERLKSAGISPAPFLVSLARDRVILKDIRFPGVPESEEPNIIRFQAVKELTDAADDVIIDYAPVTDRTAPERRATALIVRKEIVTAYQTLMLAAGLRLAAVTPRPFGIIAAARQAMTVGGALTPPPDPVDAAVAVVAIADKWAEFCILRGDTLLLARTLTVGPNLAGEIRRNLTVYNGQVPQRPVQAVYLSAGPNNELRQRLGELIEVPIYPFDPFAGSGVDVPGNPGGYAGAVGLLHAQAAHSRLPVNFVDPHKAIVQANPNKARALISAAVALLVVAALFVTGHFVLAGIEREVEAKEAEKAEAEKATTLLKENGKRIKALEEWDTVVWLDELYDLTARIPNVDQIHVTQLLAVPVPATTKKAQNYAAKLTIEGELLDKQRGRQGLDKFVAEFKKPKDAEYYIVDPPVVKDDKFSFSILIKKRSPEKYDRVIEGP